ncbi:MAG TPA: C25 family cysteine peptidase [Chitinophagaceae bacterium]
MKRILLFLFILTSLTAQSQQFNNEWIDYSKTYYKFKVGATGVYRITQPSLATIGLGSSPAESFQLWRNGKQIPIYTTVQTGAMGASDYIEFWGERNDGRPDNIMYRVADYQLSDKWSLQTDTAAFFLTTNSGSSNLRLEPTANIISGSPVPEPYFMYTSGKYYHNRLNQGYAQVVGENVYSSAYDAAEGWASPDVNKGDAASLVEVVGNLSVYTGAGAPDANFRINASGLNGLNPRTFRVKINSDSILGQEMNFFDYVKLSKTIPLSLISSGTATITVTNQSSVAVSDRMVVAQMELTYPRQFNFGNATSFPFSLPANISGNYLEIINFNYGSSTPVLYDLTNGKRYVADIVSTPGVIKVALQGSGVGRDLLLVSEEAANITSVTSFQQRNFVNYGLAANQGNYLMITHPVLLNGSGGTQPINDYKNYRSSAAGGSYNAKVYMIDELVDQFAFGIKMHPLSIRNFIRWTRATYSNPIKEVFLIGKGVIYPQIIAYESNPDLKKLALIPTFGTPASDILLASEPGLNEIPQTPIGRLSVINGDEITTYLDKVKQFEQAQAFQSPLIADKAWMKNVAHVVGASEGGLALAINTAFQRFKLIIQDTFFGANVHTFTKTSAETVEQSANVRLQNLFNEGISIVTYFGHSSASTLEYNLDNPQNYNNQGKYPLFILLGCNAGNFFNFNLARFQTKETISEKYVLAQQRGSIASIASTHLGIVHYLDIYNTKNYTSIGVKKYGATLGEIMQDAISEVFNLTSQNDYYARFHCEQATLHGDPALRLNPFPKPDYVIEDPLVRINPSFISIAESSFRVNASFMNIGKAVSDSITVEVKRTYPDNTTTIISRTRIPGIRFIDSLAFTIPIIATRDKGLNKITITVDADNNVPEIYETNNSITKEFFIFEDEARPVYPFNFSIISKQGIKLQASTANPFSLAKDYRMEIDTTELFNSPLKITKTLNSTGGLLEFDPSLTFTDSTVYYWRVAAVPASGTPNWNKASFVYLPNHLDGFNQSHYFQHNSSGFDGIYLNRDGWRFDSLTQNIFARNTIFPEGGTQQSEFTIAVNDAAYIGGGCNYNAILFNIFEPNTLKPWTNNFSGPGGAGLYGSLAQGCGPLRGYNFEYSYLTAASRTQIMNFLNNVVPDGYIVVARGNIPSSSPIPPAYVNVWQDDTTINGSGISLYHLLKNQGFAQLDSFNRPRTWIFSYKKNDQVHFQPKFALAETIFDKLTLNLDVKTPDSVAYITSPVLGRAKAWKSLILRGNTFPDVTPGDHPFIDVIGINEQGDQTTLFSNLDVFQQNFDISSINAATYPFLKLRMRNMDTIHYTPYQLRYWRVTFDPVPEGALAPNKYLVAKDMVELGEPYDFKVAFKNASPYPFDSLKIKLSVTDKNNVVNLIPVPRRRPLLAYPASDTIGAVIPTQALSGNNTLYIEANPDNDQPEQFHFNNFAYRNFYVKPDSVNPLLDVTFDGVHILNRDLVSSKPEIVVTLKDESKWTLLNDTSLLKLEVKFPNGQTRRFYFNNDTLQFIPASQANNIDNTATLNFNPYFAEDGEYELIVSGKDRSDNTAGNRDYRVSFQVINKPMISNMLNYPNPFTTSTAFVFTVTGSEVPQNIRIQILTITGKIVRDITKEELGPLHIGRNITEFKWDGTDQYGQKLANGIYLYRVITNLNGKTLDKYKAEGDNTDKYFNKGYGKMYLMR